MKRVPIPREITLVDKDNDKYVVIFEGGVITIRRESDGSKSQVCFFAADAATLCDAILEAARG
jgi:hypothetical protein